MLELKQPVQGFPFNFDLVFSCAQLCAKGLNDNEISEELGINTPKVEGIREWGHIVGFLDKRSKTYILDYAAKVIGNYESRKALHEIMFYNLCRTNQIANILINNVTYEIYHMISPEFNTDIAFNKIINYKSIVNKNGELKYEKLKNISDKKIRDGLLKIINLLKDEEYGLGLTGIISESFSQEGVYICNSSHPEIISAAYILLSSLETNQVIKKIDDIADEDNNLGRLFMLGESGIIDILNELDSNGIIQIQLDGGLNQVAILNKDIKSIMQI